MRKCEVCGSTKGKIYGKNGKFGMDLCSKHMTQMNRNGKILTRTRNDPNEFIIDNDILYIVLYNNSHNEIARAIVDAKYYDIVVKYKWGLSNVGYVKTQKGNEVNLLHRLITNASSDMVVDHINHNTLDNRESNLRVCTHQENICNGKVRTNSSSRITGVNFDKTRNKWKAELFFNGKFVLNKRFRTREEAIVARKEAELNYFGEYACKAN